MAKSPKRPLAVFLIAKFRSISKYMLRMRTIVLNITNNSTIFVTPVPTLASVTTNVNNLDMAETKAKTRVTGSAAERDVFYATSLEDAHALQAYVQGLADQTPDEETAISIIQASGFDLRNKGVRVKPKLDAKQGVETGTINLIAKAVAKRASYEWQQSDDGIDWTPLPTTLQAKTIAGGFTSGQKVYFRVRGIKKDATLPWYPIISIIVL